MNILPCLLFCLLTKVCNENMTTVFHFTIFNASHVTQIPSKDLQVQRHQSKHQKKV